MSIDKDRERLSQKKTLEWIRRELDPNELIPVLQTPSNRSQDYSVYSTLVPLDKVEYHRSHLEDYRPSSFLVSWFFSEDEKETTGIDMDEHGNPYLIIDPNPGETGGKEMYQRFRFSYYNLDYDVQTGEYFRLGLANNNEKVVVAVVEPNCVKIKFKELRRFLKSEDMYLMLRFDSSEYSEHSLTELGFCQNEIESDEIELSDGHLSWRYTYRETNVDGYQTECLLEARRLIGYAEIPKNKSGFIIGIDEHGNEVRRHPDEMGGVMYQGLPGWAPNPIFVRFNKEVLDRYYTRDSKYVVGDLRLIWHNAGNVERFLPLDDDHDDKVWVLFSCLDLLSDEELPHWQIHNIRPEGKVSETYINRYAPGRTSTESSRPEHRFRNRYFALSQLCNSKLGWNLLLPLNSDDEYRLRCLRVPSSDEQREFDELVQNIATILVDSLNQKGIKKLISAEELDRLEHEKDDPKSIDYLEAALYSCNVASDEKHIAFLRKLQRLRSIGSAHRKGKKYEKQLKKNFGIENQEYRQGFTRILRQAVGCLEFLIRVVRSGELIGKKELPLLYDLNEGLHTLLKELFPSGTEDVFASEAWIKESDLRTRRIADHLMIEVIGKFEGSVSEFIGLCESLMTSVNPCMNPTDRIKTLTDIAKIFIWHAERSFRDDINLIFQAQAANLQPTETFKRTAQNVPYNKKLVGYSLACVNLDEIKDCNWYRQYVAWYLSYASCYTLYAREHVWHANELDSVPVILEAVSAGQGAADVAEKVVNVGTVRKTTKDLAQIVERESG